VVQSSEKLIQRLEKSLALVFRQPFLRLTRPPGKHWPEFHIRLGEDLRGSRLTMAHEDDGSETTVMEIMLPNNRRSGFWFSFVAAFREDQSGKHLLQHASLPVFHDVGGELAPLFRADWDQLAVSCKDSTHAQPHWHFVQRPARIERIVRSLMESSVETAGEFSADEGSEFFSRLADCGLIHFAMTSLWEKNDDPPYKKKQFDSTDFPKWFENLLKYIAEQVAYLDSHMPPPGTVDVFAPELT